MFELSAVTENEVRRRRSKQRRTETDKEEAQSLEHVACDLQAFSLHTLLRFIDVSVGRTHPAVTTPLPHRVSPTAADRCVKVNIDLGLHGERSASNKQQIRQDVTRLAWRGYKSATCCSWLFERRRSTSVSFVLFWNYAAFPERISLGACGSWQCESQDENC